MTQEPPAIVQVDSVVQLNHTDLNLHRVLLDRGLPLVAGIRMYRDSWFNGYAGHTGIVSLPLSTQNDDGGVELLDEFVGGHAICIVGYEDDVDVPGGGHYIFRNSWGPKWASNSASGAERADCRTSTFIKTR